MKMMMKKMKVKGKTEQLKKMRYKPIHFKMKMKKLKKKKMRGKTEQLITSMDRENDDFYRKSLPIINRQKGVSCNKKSSKMMNKSSRSYKAWKMGSLMNELPFSPSSVHSHSESPNHPRLPCRPSIVFYSPRNQDIKQSNSFTEHKKHLLSGTNISSSYDNLSKVTEFLGEIQIVAYEDEPSISFNYYTLLDPALVPDKRGIGAPQCDELGEAIPVNEDEGGEHQSHLPRRHLKPYRDYFDELQNQKHAEVQIDPYEPSIGFNDCTFPDPAVVPDKRGIGAHQCDESEEAIPVTEDEGNEHRSHLHLKPYQELLYELENQKHTEVDVLRQAAYTHLLRKLTKKEKAIDDWEFKSRRKAKLQLDKFEDLKRSYKKHAPSSTNISSSYDDLSKVTEFLGEVQSDAYESSIDLNNCTLYDPDVVPDKRGIPASQFDEFGEAILVTEDEGDEHQSHRSLHHLKPYQEFLYELENQKHTEVDVLRQAAYTHLLRKLAKKDEAIDDWDFKSRRIAELQLDKLKDIKQSNSFTEHMKHLLSSRNISGSYDDLSKGTEFLGGVQSDAYEPSIASNDCKFPDPAVVSERRGVVASLCDEFRDVVLVTEDQRDEHQSHRSRCHLEPYKDYLDEVENQKNTEVDVMRQAAYTHLLQKLRKKEEAIDDWEFKCRRKAELQLDKLEDIKQSHCITELKKHLLSSRNISSSYDDLLKGTEFLEGVQRDAYEPSIAAPLCDEFEEATPVTENEGEEQHQSHRSSRHLKPYQDFLDEVENQKPTEADVLRHATYTGDDTLFIMSPTKAAPLNQQSHLSFKSCAGCEGDGVPFLTIVVLRHEWPPLVGYVDLGEVASPYEFQFRVRIAAILMLEGGYTDAFWELYEEYVQEPADPSVLRFPIKFEGAEDYGAFYFTEHLVLLHPEQFFLPPFEQGTDHTDVRLVVLWDRRLVHF